MPDQAPTANDLERSGLTAKEPTLSAVFSDCRTWRYRLDRKFTMADPIGPLNDFHIAAVSGFFVFAWGAVSPPRHLRHAVTARLHAFETLVRDHGCDVRALGITKMSHPRRPLYLRSDAEPEPWTRSA